MKISEYISQLQTLRDEHGELDVEAYDPFDRRGDALAPIISFRKILGPRQSTPDFWDKLTAPEQKGEKVVRV